MCLYYYIIVLLIKDTIKTLSVLSRLSDTKLCNIEDGATDRLWSVEWALGGLHWHVQIVELNKWEDELYACMQWGVDDCWQIILAWQNGEKRSCLDWSTSPKVEQLSGRKKGEAIEELDTQIIFIFLLNFIHPRYNRIDSIVSGIIYVIVVPLYIASNNCCTVAT